MTRFSALALALASLSAGCANHPIDCAVGFHHTDCLPNTAGYDDPKRFEQSDDKQCKSYGLIFGTDAYAQCRTRLASQHESSGPW